jgi:hypothetical protein
VALELPLVDDLVIHESWRAFEGRAQVIQCCECVKSGCDEQSFHCR